METLLGLLLGVLVWFLIRVLVMEIGRAHV